MVRYWDILDFIMSKLMSFCIQYDISIGSFQLSVSVLHLCCGTFCIPWNVKLQICVKCQLTWVVRIIFYDIVPYSRLWMEVTLMFNPTTQDLSRKLVNLSFWSFDLIRIFYMYGISSSWRQGHELKNHLSFHVAHIPIWLVRIYS